MMKFKFLLLLLFVFIIAACDKDDDEETHQVKYEVVNNLSVNSHIKIVYYKNNNQNIVDGPLTPGQTWSLTYAGNSGEQAYLSGLVVNDSANFDLRIILDQSIFMEDKGYCDIICDTTEVMISGTLP